MRIDRLRLRNLTHRQRVWLLALIALTAIAFQVLVIGDSVLVAVFKLASGICFGLVVGYIARSLSLGTGRSED